MLQDRIENLSKIALGSPPPPEQTTDESGYRYGRTDRDRSHSSEISRSDNFSLASELSLLTSFSGLAIFVFGF